MKAFFLATLMLLFKKMALLSSLLTFSALHSSRVRRNYAYAAGSPAMSADQSSRVITRRL
jgi:hypothetical protein